MTRVFSRSSALQASFVAIALVLPLFVAPYWIHVGALAWYYALLAASWAMLAGHAGQFSFAHCAFAALGGYGSALGVSKLGLPLAPSILFAILLAICVGALMGWLVLRLSGPYLALFTLAISEVFRLILIAEEPLTRGSLGLPVTVLYRHGGDVAYYYTGLALLLAALLAMHGLLATRIGLFLRALREDEEAARASGVNTTLCKIVIFVITSGIAALAGAYYGHFIGILTPSIVIIPEMGLVIAMAVIGGIESLSGAVIGAVLVYVLSEMLRGQGEWRFVLLGLALILIQRFAQNGLLPAIERALAPRHVQPQPARGTEASHERG
jgi:branched-chain amino acid transport system permease protein